MKGFSLNLDEISQYLDITPPFLMIDYADEIIGLNFAVKISPAIAGLICFKLYFFLYYFSLSVSTNWDTEAFASPKTM